MLPLFWSGICIKLGLVNFPLGTLEEEKMRETGTQVGAVGWSKLAGAIYSELDVYATSSSRSLSCREEKSN